MYETQMDDHNVINPTVETNETFATFGVGGDENVNENTDVNGNSDDEEFDFVIDLDNLTPLENVQQMTFSEEPIENTYEISNITNEDLSEDEHDQREEEEFNRTEVWPLRDRSDSHPVTYFNSIEGIVEFRGDGDYFDEKYYASDDSLSMGQKFRTKDH